MTLDFCTCFSLYLLDKGFTPEQATDAVNGLRRGKVSSVRLLRAWLECDGLAAIVAQDVAETPSCTVIDKDTVATSLRNLCSKLVVRAVQMHIALLQDIETTDSGTRIWRLRQPAKQSIYKARDIEIPSELLGDLRIVARYGREGLETVDRSEPLLIRGRGDIRPWSYRQLHYLLGTAKSTNSVNETHIDTEGTNA